MRDYNVSYARNSAAALSDDKNYLKYVKYEIRVRRSKQNTEALCKIMETKQEKKDNCVRQINYNRTLGSFKCLIYILISSTHVYINLW